MANLPLYKKILGLESEDAIADEFLRTLLLTNRTFDFFVDWQKVAKNVEALKYEIGILNGLVGSKNIKADFKEVIERYPEVVKVFPLIIAVRDSRIRVVDDLKSDSPQVTDFDFSSTLSTTSETIEGLWDFCEKTGIIALFSSLKMTNLRDYLLGVEVGLDTNARKNRSGTSMEGVLLPILTKIAGEQSGLRLVAYKTFESLERDGIRVPSQLRARKFDYAFIKSGRPINIEVNFYSGGGSKPQEIIDSYINRQQVLEHVGWGFILITDGAGWQVGANQLKRGITDMHYILNLHFIRQGMLKAALTT